MITKGFVPLAVPDPSRSSKSSPKLLFCHDREAFIVCTDCKSFAIMEMSRRTSVAACLPRSWPEVTEQQVTSGTLGTGARDPHRRKRIPSRAIGGACNDRDIPAR